MTSPRAMHDLQLNDAANSGSTAALDELTQRQFAREVASGGAERPSSDWIALTAMLAIPVVLLVVVAGALADGLTALANESVLASLFPREGDSVARYVVSVVTLIVLIPGPLAAAARWLRGRPGDVLGRFVLMPLAVLLVPAIMAIAYSTAATDVIRLAS